MLINDILDLSKIESGTVVLDVGELRFSDLHDYVERTFRHVAEAKGVDFHDRDRRRLCRASLTTDAKRLQQIIKNLLSNAFKFTHRGRVSLARRDASRRLEPRQRWRSTARDVRARVLRHATPASAFPPDKQQIIFEAFQQADGSTSRKYGGTGLGLAISREIARLLGGEIRLDEHAGRGQHVHAVPAADRTPRSAQPRARPIAGQAGRGSRPVMPTWTPMPAAGAEPLRAATRCATTAARSSPATACC